MSDQGDSVTEALMQLNENLTKVIDSVDGYRAELQRRGYSETASEVMAMHFHEMLIKATFKAAT